MADPNVGQAVASAFEAVIAKKPVDQIFKGHFLFEYFTKENGGLIEKDGGSQIEVPLDYRTNPSFRSYSDMAVIDTNRVDTIDAARYDWKEHSGAVVWSMKELFKCSGDEAKFDYLAAKIENAIKSHKEDIALALVGSNTNSTDVNGLQYLVPDNPATSVSPGGINRQTFTWWRSNAASGAKTAVAFDNLRAKMREMYNDCSTGFNSSHPTVVAFGRDPYAGYEGTLTANERFADKKAGDGGFADGTLRFKGADVGYDSRISDARGYFLNPDGLKLVVGKGHFLKQGKEIESINQNASVKKFHSFLQLVNANPRLLGVLYGID